MTLSPYQYEQAVSIVERTLNHMRDGTTDQEPGHFRIPVSQYMDEGRWQVEMDAIFKRLPLMLGFTCEMRNPGDYKTIQILDVPVLMVRAKDGKVRAFINVCSHRGAKIATEPCGNGARFVCPYHAWTYNDRGDLVGIASRSRFGEVDRDERRLKELPCEERAGMVFVCLTPGLEFDLEHFLGQMLVDLESMGIADWHMYAQTRLESANWKLTHDGYLETYHVPFLHKESLSHLDSTIMVFDSFGPYPFGPHQRMAGTGVELLDMKDKPKSEWTDDALFHAIRTVFPNISISASNAGGLVSQLIPVTVDHCITIQNVMFSRPPQSEDERKDYDAMVELMAVAVRDEDYLTGYHIQNGLGSGANKDFIFGRNEVGPQRWHRAVNHYVDAAQQDSSDALKAAE